MTWQRDSKDSMWCGIHMRSPCENVVDSVCAVGVECDKGMQWLQLSHGLSALTWVEEVEHNVDSSIMVSVHF